MIWSDRLVHGARHHCGNDPPGVPDACNPKADLAGGNRATFVPRRAGLPERPGRPCVMIMRAATVMGGRQRPYEEWGSITLTARASPTLWPSRSPICNGSRGAARGAYLGSSGGSGAPSRVIFIGFSPCSLRGEIKARARQPAGGLFSRLSFAMPAQSPSTARSDLYRRGETTRNAFKVVPWHGPGERTLVDSAYTQEQSQPGWVSTDFRADGCALPKRK